MQIGTYGYVVVDAGRSADGKRWMGFYHSVPGRVIAISETTITLRYRSGDTKEWPRDRFQAYSNQAHARMASGF